MQSLLFSILVGDFGHVICCGSSPEPPPYWKARRPWGRGCSLSSLVGPPGSVEGTSAIWWRNLFSEKRLSPRFSAFGQWAIQIWILEASITSSEILKELCLINYLTSRTLKYDIFTIVFLVTRPLSGSEAGVDLVLMQTLLLFICKYKLVSMRTTWFTCEKQTVLYQTKVNSSLTST